MSNIEAFLKDKYNVGLLTDDSIEYDNDVAQSDDYEASQFDNFWGVRDGPNAKQTVSTNIFNAFPVPNARS